MVIKWVTRSNNVLDQSVWSWYGFILASIQYSHPRIKLAISDIWKC